jgi:opacity protein-like surface antigen
MNRMNVVIVAGVALTALSAAPVFAQDGYMFGMPRATLTLRVGAARPAADSEVFRFFTDQLTLNRNDFTSATVGADLGVRVHPQIDVMLSVGIAHSTNDSEFRDFVEDNDQPIRQTTELTRTPVTAGVKLHLLPRGRSLGRLAFVPNRVSPYVGGGAGVLWYQLEQFGDFVDFETLDIFTDHFDSEGATFTANAFAGGDLWVMSRLALNVEGRYTWAKANLHDAFADFEKIDLRGWQLTAGISLRY